MATDRSLTSSNRVFYIYIMIGVWHWFSMVFIPFLWSFTILNCKQLKSISELLFACRSAQWAKFMNKTDSICYFCMIVFVTVAAGIVKIQHFIRWMFVISSVRLFLNQWRWFVLMLLFFFCFYFAQYEFLFLLRKHQLISLFHVKVYSKSWYHKKVFLYT